MFEASIVFKAIAGIGVASTGSCGAYYLMKNNNFLNKEEQTSDTKSESFLGGDKANLTPDKYYIAELKTVTTDEPTKELYEENAKNFKCTFTVGSEQKEDPNCDVFTVTQDKTSTKLLNLDIFTKATTNPKKSDLKTVSTKVKIKSPVIDEFYWNKLEGINLTIKSTTEESKNYGIFTLKYSVSRNNPVGKTNLFIVKAIDEVEYTGTINVSNKCMFGTKTITQEDDAKSCSLYKLKSQFDDKTNYKDVSFDEKIEDSKINDGLKVEQFFVVDLKNDPIDINILDSKKINYFWEKTNEQGEKIKTYTKLEPIHALSSDNSFTKDSKPIILA